MKGSVAAVRGLGFTRRMVAVLVVLGMLALSYVSSLTVYFRQQQQIGQAKAEIAARESQITTLEDEITRWKDPNFVKAQARSRLGWVMPGETGYRVIGPDGKPLGGGVQIESESDLPSDEHPTVWWERMVGSVNTADNPVPEKEQAEPPVVKQTPSPKPTPSR